MRWLWIVYAVGVVIGLLRTDARWPARIGLALAWPVAPLAFVVTGSLLLVTALIAFPIFGVVVALTVLVMLLVFS